MIVFAVALGRIAWLLNKLKKFGYVQHRFILRLHIAICAFDIVYNIFASWTLLGQIYNAVQYTTADTGGEGEYKYHVHAGEISTGLCIYQSSIVLNQFLLLVVIYNV